MSRAWGALVGALAAGTLFGLGLARSGMTDTARVRGFLDFAGAWNPSLLFVMGGAVLVHGVASRLIARRGAPLFDARFHPPVKRAIDARLVGGSALFGVGWALGGFCPGPGLVSLTSGAPAAIVFVVAMGVGIRLVDGARA